MEIITPFVTKTNPREARIVPIYEWLRTTVSSDPDHQYDLFLSFPDEDKSLATELFNCLQGETLRTWFSQHDLRKGSSIIATINQAILESRNAVILLTPNTLAENRHFPLLEIYALLNQHMYNDLEKIFIIYHGVHHGVVVQHFPLLADYYSFSTQQGLEGIAGEIAELIC